MKTLAPLRHQAGNTWVGIFAGLVIGVVVSFGVVWYMNRSPLPFQDKAARADKGDEKPAAGATPQPLPAKPGEKPVEKPRFDFYKILPGGQEAVPGGPAAAPAPGAAPAATPAGGKAAAAAPAAPAIPVAAAPTEIFYLQLGAFQKPADADNLKAKLALMGLEAGIQQVNIPDRGTFHRVRVGPFANGDDMNKVRNQLSQGGIQATVVKEKPAAAN